MNRFKAWMLALTFTAASLLATVSAAQAIKVSEIEVSGALRTDKSLILTACGLLVGEELSTEKVQQAIKHLYSLGIFSDIRILAVQTGEDEVRLTIAVKELPVLEKVTFIGNKRFKDTKLKKLVGLRKGQVLSPKAIKDAQQKLLSFYKKEGYLLAQVTPESFQLDKEGRIILNFRIREGKKLAVKRIRIHGNKAVSQREIKKQMKTKEARWWRKGGFKEEVLQQDLNRIVDFYRKQGFRDAKVVKDSLSYDMSKKNLFVDITVSEGPRYRFGRISWEGNKALSDKELSQLLTINPGDIYNQEKLDNLLAAIRAAYYEKGYLSATVIPSEPVVDNRVSIHLSLEEGTVSKIREITIAGNTKTKEKVIRRELSIKPGQVFRRSVLERSIRDVYQLNFFSSVEPEVKPLPNGDVDIIINIEEKSTGQAMAGLGYSERDKLVGSVGFNIPNLFGNGQSLELNCDFGTRRETFRFSFTEPWLLGTPTAATLSIYSTKDKWESHFDEKRQGGYGRIGRRLTWPDTYSRVYLRYRLESVEYLNFSEDFSNPLGLKENQPQVSSSLGLTFLRDSRDMPQFPTRGSMCVYTLDFAGGPLQGDESYHKQILESDFYFPILWKLTLMLKLKLGLVDAFGSDRQVPPSERFKPGGTSLDGMIRGYSDWSVGPVQQGVRTGGRAMLVSTAQLQFPLVRQQLYGLLFADAGNAWRWASKANPFHLKRSVGVGMRVVVPMMGTIGLDFAYGFDNPSHKWRSHFQFGTSF